MKKETIKKKKQTTRLRSDWCSNSI